MKNIFYYITFFCFIFGVSYVSSSKIDYKAYKYAIKKQMLNNQTETLSKKDFYSNLNERTGHVIHMVNDRTERIIHMEGRPDCPDGYVEEDFEYEKLFKPGESIFTNELFQRADAGIPGALKDRVMSGGKNE